MEQIYLQLHSKRPIRPSEVLEVAKDHPFTSTSIGWDEEKLCKGPPKRKPGSESY